MSPPRFRPALHPLEGRDVPATFLWAAPGTSGSFAVAAHWEDPSGAPWDRLPGPGDDLVFGPESSADCPDLPGGTFASVELTAAYGGTVTALGDLTLPTTGTGTLTVAGGAFASAGRVTASSVAVTGGTAGVAGGLTVDALYSTAGSLALGGVTVVGMTFSQWAAVQIGGAVTVTGSFDADAVWVTGGSLDYRGRTTLDDVTVYDGVLYLRGDTTIAHALSAHGGAVVAEDDVTAGTVTVAGPSAAVSLNARAAITDLTVYAGSVSFGYAAATLGDIRVGTANVLGGALTSAGVFSGVQFTQSGGMTNFLLGGDVYSGTLSGSGDWRVGAAKHFQYLTQSGGLLFQLQAGADVVVTRSFVWTGGTIQRAAGGPNGGLVAAAIRLRGNGNEVMPATGTTLWTYSPLVFEGTAIGFVYPGTVRFVGDAAVRTEPGTSLTFLGYAPIEFLQPAAQSRNHFGGATVVLGGSTTSVGRTTNTGDLTVKDLSTLSCVGDTISDPNYKQTVLTNSRTTIEEGSTLRVNAIPNGGGALIDGGTVRTLYRAGPTRLPGKVDGNLTVANCHVHISQDDGGMTTTGTLEVTGTVLWDVNARLHVKVDTTLGVADRLFASGVITVHAGGTAAVVAHPFTNGGVGPPYPGEPAEGFLFLQSGTGIDIAPNGGVEPPVNPASYQISRQPVARPTWWSLKSV